MHRTHVFIVAIVGATLVAHHVGLTQWVRTGGPGEKNVKCLAGSGSFLVAGTERSVYRSSTNGETWNRASSGLRDTTICAVAFGDPYLFAGLFGGGVYRSTDNGDSWIPKSTGISTGSTIYSFTVNGTSLYAGGVMGDVFRSTDSAENWSLVGSGLPVFSYVSALVAVDTNLFAGTSADGVYRFTSNTGWMKMSTGLPTFCAVYALLTVGDHLFAGTYQGIFRSSDRATTWDSASAGLMDVRVYCLAASGMNIFAGTYSEGVFLSTDLGESWSWVGSGLSTYEHVFSLAVFGTNLFVGTNDSVVWRRPLSEMITGVNDLPKPSPTTFSLHQNYPNPFNPVTVVRYSLIVNGYTTLKVYDVLGREVATLVNEVKRPGEHIVRWDASDYPSGVYFCRLQASGASQTRKLLLLR